MSIEDTVHIEEQSISQYAETSDEEFLTVTPKESVMNKCNGETNELLKNRLKYNICKNGPKTLQDNSYDKQVKKQTQRTGRG